MSSPNLGLAELTVTMLAGRSVVTEQYSQAPLQLHRPLYLDGNLYPTVFLKTPSAGLLGGDKHQLSVHASENSTIKILNQSATLVYTGVSEQTIEIYLERGATVFFEPCPLILAAGANFTQSVRINMVAASRLHYIDEWSAGRIAMNESFRFERFDNTIEIFVAGSLQYREHFVLQPQASPVNHSMIGHHYTRFKSVYNFGPWQDDDLFLSASESPTADRRPYLPDGLAPDLAGDLSKNMAESQCESLTESLTETLTDSLPQKKDQLAWRLKRPCGTIDRLLSVPSKL